MIVQNCLLPDVPTIHFIVVLLYEFIHNIVFSSIAIEVSLAHLSARMG